MYWGRTVTHSLDLTVQLYCVYQGEKGPVKTVDGLDEGKQNGPFFVSLGLEKG